MPDQDQNQTNVSRQTEKEIKETLTAGASPKKVQTRTTESYQPHSTAGVKIERTLKTYGREKEENFTKNKANSLGYPYVNLMGKSVSPKVLLIIPKETASKFQIIPYVIKEGKLWIAAVNPEDGDMLSKVLGLARPHNLDIALALASKTSIEYALKNYDYVILPKEPKKELEISGGAETTLEKGVAPVTRLKSQITQVSTSRLLDTLLSGAMQTRASDIHLEPKEKTMRIRYRIDGVLYTICELPYESYKLLRSRIKFLAKMKMDLTNVPQDGQFSVTSTGKKIDIRVSSLPTVYGENLVLRLLVQEERFYTLKDLGFNRIAQELVLEAIQKPHGMLLNTGPTGSGKTTTLYAILDYLNKPGVKIITLEDPVEYRIPGINQSQIDISRDYGFAEGIRSVIRQDPDIIMIGEMRDRETAKIGIQAALTGHLVLSTLHTNNAVATMVRLIDMGIEPFLLPGSINLVIAQRLVRKICSHCREKYALGQETLAQIQEIWQKTPKSFRGEKTVPQKLWRGKGCDICNNTGYMGRIPVAEVLKPDPEIENLVITRRPDSEIQKLAVSKGMITMLEDGISKVIDGITTFDEVWRVTRE